MAAASRRIVVGLIALVAAAVAVLVLGFPRQQRDDPRIADEAACTAAGGQWIHLHLPHPGDPKSCLLPATDGGQRCLSTVHCRDSVCRRDPASPISDGFQVGRCDGISRHIDCGDVVRNGFPRRIDCPLE
jgi:hypothetical protein